MKLRLPGLAAFALAASTVSCAGRGAPAAPNGSGPASCAGGTDTTKVPLNDLGSGCYKSYAGGLYPGGSNTIPSTHLVAGFAAAALIQPLDTNGNPSASGKYVLLSIGMSNTTQEFCSDGGLPGSCQSTSFMGQAAADATVNHTTLVIVNGAAGGKTANQWTSATSVEYDRIRTSWLTPLGLSEKQVQIAWVKVADAGPTRSLPDPASDAYVLEGYLGSIARALKTRYPNLRQVFFSSRIYAGYATTTLNPEPYAYENGFSVKWAIQSQMDQMAGLPGDSRTGNLRYDTGVAPWMAWGSYLWAAGTRARSDGLTWVVSDFAGDGTHPASAARQKVGALLLQLFKTSDVTRCWFLAGQRCG
ncbi:MAG TPA: hypothetical protein VJL28_12825 [Gemmatimonadaceae bacterium]|nr:hypothetical protein [Gemmatimonadaceae bacterium]